MDEHQVSLTLKEWDKVLEAVFAAETKEANLYQPKRSEELKKIKKKIKRQLPGYC